MTTVLFDPAAAIAAGICLTARSVAPKTLDRHPRPCGWCEYEPDELRQMIDGFNAWAGFRERSGTYERHDARVFAELPRAEQARLVLEAQAFPLPARVPAASRRSPSRYSRGGPVMTPSWMRPD